MLIHLIKDRCSINILFYTLHKESKPENNNEQCLHRILIRKGRSQKMEKYVLVHTVLLSILNVLFAFSGIFLNIVVVLCFWKSSQLRKKSCFFMILVLSCFDLAVAFVAHPILIFSTIAWYVKGFDLHRDEIVSYILLVFYGFSMVALMTMNFDRYLSLAYPLFHRRWVTKNKLGIFLAVLQVYILVGATLSFRSNVIPINFSVTFAIGLLVIVVVLTNYKMYVIAKHRKNATNAEGKSRRLQFKKCTLCLLAATTFLLCCVPALIYHGLVLANAMSKYSNVSLPFLFWYRTIIAMNSTFNCTIFFWKNHILRSEGTKLLKGNK